MATKTPRGTARAARRATHAAPTKELLALQAVQEIDLTALRRERANALKRLQRRKATWVDLLADKPGVYEVMLDLGVNFTDRDSQFGVHTAKVRVAYDNIIDEEGFFIPCRWLRADEKTVRREMHMVTRGNFFGQEQRIHDMWWFLSQALGPLIAERQAAREARRAAKQAVKTADQA